MIYQLPCFHPPLIAGETPEPRGKSRKPAGEVGDWVWGRGWEKRHFSNTTGNSYITGRFDSTKFSVEDVS
jgi:hypothetical protein